MNNIKYILVLLLAFNILSCDSPGDATVDPPPELITDVLVILKDSANMQDSVIATFSDPDGPSGSVQPTITGVTLSPGKTYIGMIRLEDRSKTPLEDITEEIREESDAHQFFYTPSEGLQLHTSVEITDQDDNGLPLGLEFKLRTSVVAAPATGILNVVLSHFEEAGSKNGTDRSDESDIDIDFPVTIQ
jgi:hypothetical protein